MKTILLTGSEGFIGTHLCDSLSKIKKFKIKKVKRSDGNIVKSSTWKKFPKYKIVIHLAAKNFVPKSWKNIEDFFEVNVKGTIQALDYCRKKKSRLIFVSSYMYGNAKKIPISERETVKPTNPYTMSKKIAEDICRYYASYYGVKVTIIRPFNIYGFGQKNEFLIPTIINQFANKKIIKVNDLRPKRDFIYVKDFVEAIIKTISLNKNFEIINIASGKSYSVRSIIKIIRKLKKDNLKIKSLNKRRTDEIFDTRANIYKAKKLLKWKPTWSFTQGLEDSYG